MAALRMLMASGLGWQSLRSWRGVIRPFTSGPLWPKRLVWRARASSTWARKSEEGGPGGISASWVKGTAGTSTCRSMRSSRGPEILLRYFSTWGGVQEQARRGSDRYPHGLGFIENIALSPCYVRNLRLKNLQIRGSLLQI